MSAGEEPPDFERIFSVFAEHEVDYVLVGGLAVQTYGHMRATVDVDVIPRPDPANLGRLAQALRALDARVLNRGAAEIEISAAMLPRATLWQFSTKHGAIDVLHDAPGAAPYEQLRERALVVHLGVLAIAVASKDDLVGMKRASGRPVDLDDIAALTEPEHDFEGASDEDTGRQSSD